MSDDPQHVGGHARHEQSLVRHLQVSGIALSLVVLVIGSIDSPTRQFARHSWLQEWLPTLAYAIPIDVSAPTRNRRRYFDSLVHMFNRSMRARTLV